MVLTASEMSSFLSLRSVPICIFATMGSTISRMGFLVRSDFAEGANVGQSEVMDDVKKIGSIASVTPFGTTLVGDDMATEEEEEMLDSWSQDCCSFLEATV